MTEKQYQVEHWTNALAVANYEKQDPLVVTVNDRAATRQAIINKLRGKGVLFFERSDWHPREVDKSKLTYDWNYEKIAIHHAGRSYRCGSGAHQIMSVQSEHRDKKGYTDVGYHYLIDCLGDIYEGRDIRFQGANVKHKNPQLVGIVLLENLSEPEDVKDTPAKVLGMLKMLGMLSTPTVPDSQISALKTLIKSLQEFFPISTLGGHSEFAGTSSADEERSCPGTHGLKLAKELREWSRLKTP